MAWLVLRIALVLAAIWIVTLAAGRYVDFQQDFSATFRPDLSKWFAVVSLGILGGIAFGLAVVLPRARPGYRWTDLLALGIPTVLYAVALTVFVLRLREQWHWPAWIDRQFFEGNLFSPQVSLAVFAVLGLAIVAGFRGRDPAVDQDPGVVPATPGSSLA
jgi:hypothetical protein